MKDLFKYYKGKLLYNKIKPGIILGNEVGSLRIKDGYRQLKVEGKVYLTHRIIWEMFNGKIDKELEIDHINRIRDDNRIENLRLVTRSENLFNQDAKGYYYNKNANKYMAQIQVDKVKKNLGLYNTKIEAQEAYLKAKLKLHRV